MEEEIFPVCSPALLQRSKLRKPSDLAGLTLIHDLSVETRVGFASWGAWLEKAGVTEISTKRGLQVNSSAAVLQAAIEGHGVALARSVMARDDLTAGRLTRIFPQIEFSSRLAYYVVYRSECATLPRLAAFRDWLFSEVSNIQRSG